MCILENIHLSKSELQWGRNIPKILENLQIKAHHDMQLKRLTEINVESLSVHARKNSKFEN